MNTRGAGRPPATTHGEVRDIALRLFLDQGYAHTSLASIARAAGISRTTLFAYFRSKRDMIWQDHDLRTDAVLRVLEGGREMPVVDLIVNALLASTRYEVEDHAPLAIRLRIVEQDDELRAYTALAVKAHTARICEGVSLRRPDADPRTIRLVTGALVAATSVCTEEWAALDQPTIALDVYIREGIGPIAEALRYLLP